MAENFSQKFLIKHNNLQIQEELQTPAGCIQRQAHLDTFLKLMKSKDKGNILEASREKKAHYIQTSNSKTGGLFNRQN